MESNRLGEFVLDEEFSSSAEKVTEESLVIQEKVKHLLIGSPVVVHRTIQILHTKDYCEAGAWSKPVLAGGLGDKTNDVLVILIRQALLK